MMTEYRMNPVRVLLFLMTALSQPVVHAGPYNFSDVLIGDRAMGMGGAFAGVSDDSSALYYNPAGLGYASSSNLSAAVNAFQYTQRDYKNIFAGKDSFYENSQDVIPSFTGGVIDLRKISDGLHGAFALQNLTQQSANQNDFVRRPDIGLEYLHRAEKSQLSELVFAVGAGKRFGANYSLGVSLGGRQMSFDRLQFQDVNLKASTPSFVKLVDAIAAKKSLFLSRSRNTHVTASAVSLEFGSGMIWTPAPWLSVGFSAYGDLLLNQSLDTDGDEIALFHYNDLSLPSATDFEALPNASAEDVQSEIDALSNKVLQRTTSNNQTSGITYKNLPLKQSQRENMSLGRSRFRLGVAAFPSPKLMLTFDVSGHHTRTEWILNSTSVTDNIFNFHQGIEYFFTPQFFIREGLFTNFDSRPEKLNATNNERIDFVGVSMFFGTQTSESQFSLGGIYQYGWGQALKTDTQNKPTPVRENKVLLAFTASHGL